MTIKAIETIYKNYRFRSRLEARWAVMFDAAGADWDYEQEGFNLNGNYYLPDFKVDNLFDDTAVWFEIKPEIKDCQDDDIERADKLFALLVKNTGTPGFICFGPPHKSAVLVYQPDAEHERGVKRELCDFRKLYTLRPAIAKAQAARFEHGENSNV